jgi:GBP family porin
MKKTLLAAALTGAFATVAHAQSSVTLYGLLDAGISYTNNVRTAVGQGSGDVRFSSGLMQGDRWGLKGSEDLGGGLKAVFDLENGFNIGTGALGQGGREFGRNAYVGLSSDTAGTVTLGRQNEFMYDYVGHLSFEDFNGAGGSAFAHVLDNDNMNGTFRVDNSVRYVSPNYDGLTVGGLYGFSNQADGFANNRAYSFGANYANGPIKAALAYTQVNNSGALTNALNTNAAGGAVDSSTTSGDSQFTAQLQRTFGGGANYTFGAANVGFVITDTKLTNATGFSAASGSTITAPADVRFTNYELNAHYSLTPALTLGAAYDYTDGSYNSAAGSISPKWNQFSLLSDYALSKRTDVYALGTYQHLSGGFAQGTAGVPTSFEGAATSIGSTAASPNQVVFGVGLRTRF